MAILERERERGKKLEKRGGDWEKEKENGIGSWKAMSYVI